MSDDLERLARHKALSDVETTALFFAHGASGPGETTYSPGEIYELVKGWISELRKMAGEKDV